MSPNAAGQFDSGRSSIRRAHHQRNVAQYPELTSPQSGRGINWFDRLNTLFTRGNVSGPGSRFALPGGMPHEQMHQQWQFGQPGPASGWSRFSTHGPWTPAWNVTSRAQNLSLPVNHTSKHQ